MTRISLDPHGLTTYASTATTMAATLATAATRAATADPLLLTPAFGLIGADFLTAYRAAHATQVDTLSSLTAVLAGIGVATTTAETSYVATDTTYAAALRGTDSEVQ